MERYDHQAIESKWQKIWEDSGLYKTRQEPARENFYSLTMFPYPSGDLHTGHWFAFSPPDAYSRFQRMRGKNVLHPIGFDAFGLPAENAAIQRHIPPAEWTGQNVANMTRQLKLMGPMYDWDKVINTSKPDYYRWTQWLFLLLYNNGLAYRKKGWQNWCPKDQTVLANEQVVGENNVCERCGTPVIKKELEEWFFKITDYADQLLEGLKKIDWPEKVKVMQQNWIGRSEGALVKFTVADSQDQIEVFTTRPDTLFGATYMVLAPEHPMVKKITTQAQAKEVEDYQHKVEHETELDRMETKDKTGVFTGSYAVNPVNQEKIPVWISDYVLMGYGTGAIMAVPAHDERDFEFATKFKLPVRNVIDPVTGSKQDNPAHKNKIVALVENAKGEILTINWGPKLGGRLLVGGTMEEGEDPVGTAKREVAEETGYGDLELVNQGQETVHHEYFAHSKGKPFVAHTAPIHFRLKNDKRDEQKLEDNEKGKFKVEWVSRDQAAQEVVDPLHRYVFDKFIIGKIHVDPGTLVNSGKFSGLSSTEAKKAIVEQLFKDQQGSGQTQYRLRDWLISRQRYWGAPIPIIYCDKCGIVPVPEDQLPVELPLDVKFEPSGRSPLEEYPDFYQTKCPKCGADAKRETDTMDTFVDSSWYFLRYPDTQYDKGPFNSEAVKAWLPVDQYMGGVEHAILHLLYARFITKVLHEQKLVDFDEPFERLFNQGIILGPDGQKMSKSRGNVVNPEDWVHKYGADTFRVYLMFIGPWDQGGPFNPQGIAGVNRFLHRVWALVQELAAVKSEVPGNTGTEAALETALTKSVHKTIKQATQDLESFGFNTAVAALMELVNQFYKLKVELPFTDAHQAWETALKNLLKLLAPLAPHISEELWHLLGEQESIHVAGWPVYDPALIKEDLVEIVIQVNGKLRATITLPVDTEETEVVKAAKDQDAVKKHLDGGTVAKTIFVPRKLVNFVIK